jgi:hypothetical protein
LRTTARMTALRPGQSPPPVSTPIFMLILLFGYRSSIADPARAIERSGAIC